MAKHKKKQSQHSREKLAVSRRRNEFFYRLEYLITAITADPSIFKLIPQSEYKVLLAIQVHAPRVTIAPGSIVPNEVFNEIKHFILWSLKTNTVPFTDNGPVITYNMFMTTGLSLIAYINLLKEDAFPGAKTFKKTLAEIIKEDDRGECIIIRRVLDTMTEVALDKIPMIVNNFQEAVYWTEYHLELVDKLPIPMLFYEFRIGSYHPEKKNMVVRDKVRPAYEVCWCFTQSGVFKLTLDQLKLGLSAEKYPTSLPVYIQSHAINRVYERIDCMMNFLVACSILESLHRCSYFKDAHQKYFIDFYLVNKKVGYLVGSVQQGSLLIHTFLLITNNGTPEGDRLASSTKLNKLDKEYLSIDKLSAFYASDISDNPEVKKLFIDAGCTDLFDLDPVYLQKGTCDQKKPLAGKIRDYLNYKNADEQLDTYRKEQMPT